MLFRSNDTATTEIYTVEHTLSLHDALPISGPSVGCLAVDEQSPQGSLSGIPALHVVIRKKQPRRRRTRCAMDATRTDDAEWRGSITPCSRWDPHQWPFLPSSLSPDLPPGLVMHFRLNQSLLPDAILPMDICDMELPGCPLGPRSPAAAQNQWHGTTGLWRI